MLSLLDNLVTFNPYNSSKHFICKSSPLVEGNPGTKKKETSDDAVTGKNNNDQTTMQLFK